MTTTPTPTTDEANREVLKRFVKEVWKTLVLNDPPTWTEDNKMEWLVNRSDELLTQAYQRGRTQTINELKCWMKGKQVDKEKVREYLNNLKENHD